ncbi:MULTISPECIES: FtsB family cell division protein [Micromonospora]|uniref:Septum formation initiator family protein n=1 Tax=Micromonospora profundi TaxID=1420889 RepID=A0AAJ6HWD7_9ACTN|nr:MULTISPECIES: septum formation initiator family protein [Micromonospora]KOX09145.1 septation ring formation regulator EzrA [Micromonospora sp. NRRL B-16802]WLS46188.1 septum formation initiator family protein [Micromonospora profundi]
MQQRRTPGGQRPARRPGQSGRPGGGRAIRGSVRDAGVRAEPRGAAGRAPSAARGAEGGRSANRPAAARRTASGGSVKRLSAPHPRRFTGRATVLFAVLIALALAYTYPVQVYLDQQADIERMEAAQAAQEEEIAKLAAEAAKWKDDEYIKTQARERFFMGEPGEKMMVVLHDPEGAARDAGKPDGPATPAGPTTWYDTLWSSVRAADSQQPGK